MALFSSKLIELALCNIPGFVGTGPPAKGSPVIQHWPTLISQSRVKQKVTIGEKEFIIDPPDSTPLPEASKPSDVEIPHVLSEPLVAAPLGRVYATRSGDKGGNANLGIWGKTPESYAFLKNFLTVERLKKLLADVSQYDIERYELPNLFALNFYIRGILGDGVSASLRMDPQAKTLGEYLRAKIVDLPKSLLNRI